MVDERAATGAEAARDDAEAGGAEWRVALPTFEGPLDLLLHLVQKHELDILDIPIAFVTEKYIEYLDVMRDLAIDVASEYLVMAATLAHIKSRMLLPADTTADDDDDLGLGEGEDPRAELIRRLLEYQKYKNAAEAIAARGTLGKDVFLRGTTEEPEPGPAPLAPPPVFHLLDAFAKILERAKLKVEHEVSFERFTITERIQQLSERLVEHKKLRFEQLFDGARTKGDLVTTFLALLEMTRLKMTRLFQVDSFSEIFIELAVASDEDAPAEGAAPPAETIDAGESVATVGEPADEADESIEPAGADDMADEEAETAAEPSEADEAPAPTDDPAPDPENTPE